MTTEGVELENAIINKPFLDAVANLWAKIRETHPEIPAADLRVAPDTRRQIGRVAHWVRVRNELALYPALLAYPPLVIAGVIVHESVHALAEAREVRDTSDKGRHHNVHFAQLSAEMGLCLLNDTADRGAADLTVHAQAWYADEITQLEAALETISN